MRESGASTTEDDSTTGGAQSEGDPLSGPPGPAPGPDGRCPSPDGPRRRPGAASDRTSGLVGLAGLALVGLVLRAWALGSPQGYLNADEAHTPIQALELLRGHAWVLVPGTPYGGNLEAWLDAPLAAVFGLSALRSKLEVTLMWLLAAVVLSRSVRHLGRGPAAAAFAAVWLPGAALVVLSTIAYPGYAAGLLATSAVVVLARPLLDEAAGAGGESLASRGVRTLPWRTGAIGVLAAVATWQHPLYGWVCAVTAAAVVWRQRRRALAVLPTLVAGGALGITPVVVTNLRNDLVTFRFRGAATVPYPSRVRAWITDLFPRAVGAKWNSWDWVAGRLSQVLAVLLLLVLVATCLAVLRWSPPSGKVAAAALLAAPVVMTLLGGNTSYTFDGRYAAMALPAAAIAVGHGVALLPRGWTGGHRVHLAIVAWAIVAVVAPLRVGGDPLRVTDEALDELVAFLDARQVTAVRADYWVAYRIVVRTDERIAASPLSPVKFERYERRVRRAEAATGGAGVLVLETDQVGPYLAAAPPFDAAPLNGFSQFRGHQRVDVAEWSVFLPPSPAASTTTGGG